MLSSTLFGAFTTPVTYALLVILLGTAIMQIHYVNKALQRFDSTQVIPIQFVTFTLSVIIGSAVLYRDFERTTAEQAAKFVGGCLLTFFGVFLITSGRKQQDDEEDILSEAEGIEETIGLRHHEAANGSEPPNGASASRSPSRRSSRVSRVGFVETVKPGSHGDEPDSGPFMSRSGAESAPDLLTGDEPSPLADNPWQEPWDHAASTPSRSSRALYTNPTVATSSTVNSTPSNSFPATPTKDLSRPLSHPADRPVTPRPTSALHHRSKTFISPSPLSSTVTTVFKDGFLRENEGSVADRSSLRRIRSSIRASLFFGSGDADGDEGWRGQPLPAPEDLVPATPRGQEADEPAAETGDAVRRRARSISDALGDFFQSKGRRKSHQALNIRTRK